MSEGIPPSRAASSRSARLALPFLGIIATLAARPLGAQTVRGTLAEEGSGAPIEGALVVLVDETGLDVSASLTDEAGAYVVRAPGPGRYALKAERIGYETFTSDPVSLTTGQVVERRLAMPVRPVELAALNVSTERRCETRATEGPRTARIWEEARKALKATALTQKEGAFRFTTRLYTRTLDPKSLKVRSEQAEIRTGVTTRPFRALPVEELAAKGYVRQLAPDTTEYFAPDADVLLSDLFQDDHCFRTVDGSGATEGMIGLAFEPLLEDSRTDVAGVLWLDQSNAYLRFIEYRYENLPSPVRSEAIGGRLSFRRLPGGAWIVKDWSIRMPLGESVEVVERRGPPVPGIPPQKRREFRLHEIREQGGEVLIVADPAGRIIAGDQPVSRGRGALEGTVVDSTTGLPLAGATVLLLGTNLRATSDVKGHYSMTDLPVGDFYVTFSHERASALRLEAVLQSVHIRSGEVATVHLAVPPERVLLAALCPDTSPEASAVVGTVTEVETGRAVSGARIRVSNQVTGVLGDAVDATELASRGLEGIESPESLAVFETTSDVDGDYLFCGLPPGMRAYAVATTLAPSADPAAVGSGEPRTDAASSGAPETVGRSRTLYFTVPRGVYVARLEVRHPEPADRP